MAKVNPERNAYHSFKAGVGQPHDRIDRIENGVVAGMPDVNCCIAGHECWIEIKAPTEPFRLTTPLFGSNHRISQEQMNWMLRQQHAGGRAYFLIATDKHWMLLDNQLADTINSLSMPQLLHTALWTAIKPIRDRTQWNTLRSILLK